MLTHVNPFSCSFTGLYGSDFDETYATGRAINEHYSLQNILYLRS